MGSAYTSLGVLYYKVPGWPLSFGNNKKALNDLKKGLELNPDGIDSNYFYAEYLYEEEDDYQKAKTYLLKAQNAPARATRPLADQGRQKEINQLMQKIENKLE
jgi:tetratricopeptide (TPR) repeat protein